MCVRLCRQKSGSARNYLIDCHSVWSEGQITFTKPWGGGLKSLGCVAEVKCVAWSRWAAQQNVLTFSAYSVFSPLRTRLDVRFLVYISEHLKQQRKKTKLNKQDNSQTNNLKKKNTCRLWIRLIGFYNSVRFPHYRSMIDFGSSSTSKWFKAVHLYG